jgi:uncharacterized protein
MFKDQTSVESSLNNLEDFLAKNSPKNSDGETEPIDEMKKYLTPMLSSWFHYFISYNPQENLSKMKCPVLAIYGSLDLQVPSTLNINTLEPILKKSKVKHSIVELEMHNHLMQTAITGSVNEYVQIEETMSPETLETISKWIKELK